MTDAPRKAALQDLLKKVEAGEISSHARDLYLTQSALGDAWYDAGRAYTGSLDAAMALHEAVLPGWAWAEMRLSTRPKVTLGFDAVCEEGQDPNLARAWLCAILRALIAQEGDCWEHRSKTGDK